ncbi:MAG: nitric-oxide reductase [Burkholderiaceae bacterium]|nr:MAG: nitric-oxide reductase [Burkholderiaceae bacterium]
MQIQYQTQRLSLRFFMLMLVLFLFQVVDGLILASQQVDPTLLVGVLNFNVARAEHLNLGIMWIVCGFIGAILFVGPLLSRRDMVAPWLIKLLFYAIIVIVVWNFFTQFLAERGIAGWWLGQPWFQQGLEYLEAGRIAGLLILVGFAILCFVVLRTFPPMREWNEIHWGLGLGVTALMVVWVFGLFYVDRLDLQEYFRWFVVHYWVEGVWEVIHISLIGMFLVLMFKADVKSVGFAVFWGITLVWLSGLIGNAHHYFWIGTPEFWQFWGSLFSALEPLPLVFCFWHIYLDAHTNKRPLENAPAFYFILGSTVLELVGAGILGFVMTFSLTNVWSHGTWITAGHAHLALFGTFGMLGIAAAYYAIPIMRKVQNYDQRLGKLAFWLVFAGILGMAFAFSIGGTVQVYVYRILGLDWFGGDVSPAMNIYKLMLPMFGLVFTTGAGILAYDLFTLGRRVTSIADDPVEAAHTNVDAPHAATGWHRPLTGFEAGIWLMGMWVFGFMITLSLLSFNLPRVRAGGDPTLPYLLASVGYVGMFAVTIGFVWRFLVSLEARASAPAAQAVGSGSLRGAPAATRA